MFAERVRVLTGVALLLLATGAGLVAEDPTSQPAPPKAEAAAPSSSEAEQTPPVTPTDESTAPLPEVRTPVQVSAEDVLREFQRDRPKAQPLLPKAPGEETVAREPQGKGAGHGSRLRLPDGYFLVDRAGRLVQADTWWVFTFVGDNNPDTNPDPPMRLLPNQMLERMIRESQGTMQSVEFIVSGEVTDFMGDNYLLLRKLMRKRDLGNLSK